MDSSLLNMSTVMNNARSSFCRNSSATLFWLLFSGICFIVGLLVTLIVLKDLLNQSRQSFSIKLFIFNLSVCDLIFLVSILPSVINYVLWNYKSFTYIDNLADTLSLCARPLLMACYCLDCYFAVVHPIMYRTQKRQWIVRTITITTVWLITLVCYSYKCSDISQYFRSVDSAPLIVALPVITFCDIFILKALKMRDPTGKISVHPQKKQALQTVFNSFIMTFVVYLPAPVIFSIHSLVSMNKYLYLCVLSSFGFASTMTGCVIMPILYLNGQGKLGFLRKWFCN